MKYFYYIKDEETNDVAFLKASVEVDIAGFRQVTKRLFRLIKWQSRKHKVGMKYNKVKEALK